VLVGNAKSHLDIRKNETDGRQPTSAWPRSANGMVRPCSCPASDKLARGAKDEEHVMYRKSTPELSLLASISVKTPSTLSVRTHAGRLSCGKSGHVARLRPGLPICHSV